MVNKSLIKTAVIVISLILVTGTAFSEDNKSGQAANGGNVSVLQRFKNAYSDFKARREKGIQDADKETKGIKAPAKEQPKAAVAPKVELPKAKIAKKDMTKEELLAELRKNVGENDDLFKMVPGLTAQKDENGNVSYLFNGRRVEDLSRDELEGLSTRVSQTLVRLRAERITRQLDTVKRAESLRRVSIPPPPVRTSSTPPSPPKTPSMPPAPPSTRR